MNFKLYMIALGTTILTGLFAAQLKAQTNTLVTYPKITGYVGVLHPIVTFDTNGSHTNFNGSYTVGMPTGINIWKSAGVGFSMEMVPIIRAENGTSKMNNFLFHPGILLALGKGYTFAGRAAFETSGRYGLTPVLNKTLIKNKNTSYFAAIPLPLRFGNDRPTSFTIGFQFGIAF
ncbi:hypothetical protein [Mucilaginibacter terrae]|uniref:Outer membrane protein beta-barrel domain-containing protein n=1 Tax=Mucilaginibacter terrae TaxID=1955052 RepID=A0ABU3H0S9_9SPHI|nr:hypothetical protein [Mucilaginibacter terrae]MDT3405609.1 hypothetical protein [Mucilaginibacter terrae]